LVIVKARDRKSAEDQRAVELQREVKRLRAEIKCMKDQTRAETACLINLHKETKRLPAEKAQEASSLTEERSKLMSQIEGLEKEVTRRGEDLTKATKSFKHDVAQSYLVGFEVAFEQGETVHSTLDFLELGLGKTVVKGQIMED